MVESVPAWVAVALAVGAVWLVAAMLGRSRRSCPHCNGTLRKSPFDGEPPLFVCEKCLRSYPEPGDN